jgi:hypothetical protein
MRIMQDKVMFVANIIFLIDLIMFWSVLDQKIFSFAIIVMAALYINVVTFNVYNIQNVMIKYGSSFENEERVRSSIVSSIKVIRKFFVLLVIFFLWLGSFGMKI